MARRIAVVYGGPSSESAVSAKSARAVLEALRRLGFEAEGFELEPGVCRRLLEFKPDKVFPVLHGRPGEDGSFQGMLEILGLPFVGEGVKVSAVCMDKDLTKRLLVQAGLPTPRWKTLRSLKDLEGLEELFLPAVVKPAEEGSSIGLSVERTAEGVKRSAEKLLKAGKKVLVEEFVPGREFTAGFVKGRVLPPLEIKPKGGLYDFRAKYTEGLTEFEPAPEPLASELRKLTEAVVRTLEVRELCRVDFRVDPEGRPFVLEVNTIPGLTPTSLLPKMAALAGLDFDRLVFLLVN
ncbi:MAG: D-alanine--D-alanine ligase [Aquificae bacterium]|nr:D-alanine--D-alanine ligase [Aquificota bacterium]